MIQNKQRRKLITTENIQVYIDFISLVESKFSMETTKAFFMVEKEDFYIVYVSTMVIVLQRLRVEQVLDQALT